MSVKRHADGTGCVIASALFVAEDEGEYDTPSGFSLGLRPQAVGARPLILASRGLAPRLVASEAMTLRDGDSVVFSGHGRVPGVR